jgi:hypothetical protein
VLGATHGLFNGLVNLKKKVCIETRQV